MNRSHLRKFIQQEIASLSKEEVLLAVPDLPPSQQDRFMQTGEACDHCGRSPCECESECSCRQDPCECGKTDWSIPQKRSLTCSECGEPVVMTEGCGCNARLMDVSSLSDACPDCGSSPCNCDTQDHHKGGAYMAKAQLHRIAEYATRLQDMIPEGYDLEDWMRSHISQAADDLSEVYHKMEYKTHSDF